MVQASLVLENPLKSADMVEALNIHNLLYQRKPHAVFDLLNTSFDFGPVINYGVTHKEWHHNHTNIHQQLRHEKCQEHKPMGLDEQFHKQPQRVSFWLKNGLRCYS